MSARLNWAAIIAVMTFACAACIPSIEQKSPDLGVQAANDDVHNAIQAAVYGSSIALAKPGQIVDYEQNYRISMGAVVKSAEITHQLSTLNVNLNSMSAVWSSKEDVSTYFPSGALKSDSQVAFDFKIANGNCTGSSNRLFRPRDVFPCEACDGSRTCDDGDGVKFDCIKYYNLQSQHQSVDAPVLIQQRPNCLGLTNCQFDGTYLQYDEVKFLAGQTVSRVRLMAHLSPQIPDIAFTLDDTGECVHATAATSFCEMSMQNIQGDQYQITLCTVLHDMNGQPTPMATPTPTSTYTLPQGAFL